MSKYRYLTVLARLRHSHKAHIDLPDDWDSLTDDQRKTVITESAAQDFIEHAEEEYRMLVKAMYRNGASMFEDWTIYSETLERLQTIDEVTSKALSQIVLDGTYEKKEEIDWDDDEAV